ncbi:MAG: LysR family transcriptional regulator [Chloroflexota bacterium]|nr:LysR family transcriptional regulator [Chloroflexota bacterium]
MEWQQLEHFVQVAHDQHFTHAAQRLSLSQPALSRSIARLERELGVPLFDRGGRSVRLNRYGQTFLARAERALNEIAEGRRQLSDMAGPVRGIVGLGVIQTLGAHLLPDLLGRFREAYPTVNFKLFQGNTSVLLEQLAAGESDLCLLSIEGLEGPFQRVRLFDEEVFAVVPSGHRLGSRASVKLVELKDDPFITFKHGWALRDFCESLCRQAGFHPQPTFEGEDVQTVLGLVSAGLGVALLPQSAAGQQPQAAWLHISRPRAQRAIGLTWIEGHYLSAAARTFRQFVVDAVGRPPQAGGTPLAGTNI